MSEIKTWWTEGNRKFLVTIAAIIAVAVVAVVWMVVQPEGLGFSDLMTWVAPLLGGGVSLFTGANLYEHKAKSNGTGGALLLVLLAVALTGCAGSGEVTVGDLIPEAQISREGQCLKIVVDQPVPAPEGWEATTRVTVRQDPEGGCGETEPR